MRVVHHALFLVLAAATAGISDPVPPKGKPRLPSLPTAPVVPTPMPSLDAVVTMYAGEEFIVDCDLKCVVRCFPSSALKISHRHVPMGTTFALAGRFIDGDKVVDEEREFVGPTWVYRCRVSEDCDKCYLMVLPVGGDNADVVERILKTVKGPRPPPSPVPDPKPKPPDPPVPVDEFAKAIQDAYTAELSPDKAKHVAALASLYRAAAVTTVIDPTVKTYGDLFADLKTASRTLLPESAIPGMRKVVGARLNLTMSKAADPVNRDQTAAEFVKVAAALGGVK